MNNRGIVHCPRAPFLSNKVRVVAITPPPYATHSRRIIAPKMRKSLGTGCYSLFCLTIALFNFASGFEAVEGALRRGKLPHGTHLDARGFLKVRERHVGANRLNIKSNDFLLPTLAALW